MFKVGDLVTGVDRSYKRSIYKYVKSVETFPEEYGWYEFVSLNGNVVQMWKDRGADATQYLFLRLNDEFRLATPAEINSSNTDVTRYAVRSLLMKLGVLYFERE
jgi:hypothetical protein